MGNESSHTSRNVSPFVKTTNNDRFAGFDVTTAWPDVKPRGITFLLPGALVSLGEYESTSNLLCQHGQVVLSFFINVFAASHAKFADRVFSIFQDFHAKNPNLPGQFSVVGHSVGGKVALLVAVHSKPELVKLVLALDPVDDRPPEFTNDEGATNKTLESAKATIYISWAKATPPSKINPAHNARAVFDANSNYLTTTLVSHPDAGHFAYTDHGGGLPGKLIIAGTPEGNKAALDDMHQKICDLF